VWNRTGLSLGVCVCLCEASVSTEQNGNLLHAL